MMSALPEILVVDDTPANLKLLRQILSGRGYRVRVASSGAHAIESINASQPDLILLDIKMPEMNGYEVCENLKALDETRDIPIIFISALDDVQDKVRGFHAGAVDYVTKPFQVEEVLARVETHLNLRKLQKELQDANARMSHDLELAGHMQANFMPRRLPRIEGWDFSALIKPAREMSGDFYDLFSLPNGNLCILLADVVDKGVAAALFMALSWSLIRECITNQPEQPVEAIRDVNTKILSIIDSVEYVTVFLGVLDPVSGELIYVNAGQDPPLHVRANGRINRLTRTGLPIGFSEELEWTQSSVHINHGESLILYTDGITEATNLSDEQYGIGRLEECAKSLRANSAEAMEAGILSDLQRFIADEEFQDDITVMVIHSWAV